MVCALCRLGGARRGPAPMRGGGGAPLLVPLPRRVRPPGPCGGRAGWACALGASAVGGSGPLGGPPGLRPAIAIRRGLWAPPGCGPAPRRPVVVPRAAPGSFPAGATAPGGPFRRPPPCSALSSGVAAGAPPGWAGGPGVPAWGRSPSPGLPAARFCPRPRRPSGRLSLYNELHAVFRAPTGKPTGALKKGADATKASTPES